MYRHCTNHAGPPPIQNGVRLRSNRQHVDGTRRDDGDQRRCRPVPGNECRWFACCEWQHGHCKRERVSGTNRCRQRARRARANDGRRAQCDDRWAQLHRRGVHRRGRSHAHWGCHAGRRKQRKLDVGVQDCRGIHDSCRVARGGRKHADCPHTQQDPVDERGCHRPRGSLTHARHRARSGCHLGSIGCATERAARHDIGRHVHIDRSNKQATTRDTRAYPAHHSAVQ